MKLYCVLTIVPFTFRLLTINVKERGYNLKVPENLMTQTFDATFLDCNYTRAREFYRLYKQPTDNEFVKNAVTVMLKGREILNKLEVPFWLSSGNCLGKIVLCHGGNIHFETCYNLLTFVCFQY